MVFGYPGSTSEYVSSYHIDMVKNFLNPKLIGIRTRKIEIMETGMNSDPLIRIQYSAKIAGISNSWKRWMGENLGLEKMKTIEKKIEFENKITTWINSDQYNLANSYTNEVFFRNGIEAVSLAKNLEPLVDLILNNGDDVQIEAYKINLIETGNNFFKNYNRETDKKLFVSLMTMYGANLESKWQAPEYIKLMKAYEGNFIKAANKLYKVSVFPDRDRFAEYVAGLDKSSLPGLKKDPFYLLAANVTEFIALNVEPHLNRINEEIQNLNRNYMAAQMEFDAERVFHQF